MDSVENDNTSGSKGYLIDVEELKSAQEVDFVFEILFRQQVQNKVSSGYGSVPEDIRKLASELNTKEQELKKKHLRRQFSSDWENMKERFYEEMTKRSEAVGLDQIDRSIAQ